VLAQRLIHGRGLNYWEAGMDLHLADNMYDSFLAYQNLLTKEFDELASTYNFVTVDANQKSDAIFEDLKVHILELLHNRLTKAKKPK